MASFFDSGKTNVRGSKVGVWTNYMYVTGTSRS